MQGTGPEYTSIAELAARSGTSVPCAGNLPVSLDDEDSVWFIDQGTVDLSWSNSGTERSKRRRSTCFAVKPAGACRGWPRTDKTPTRTRTRRSA